MREADGDGGTEAAVHFDEDVEVGSNGIADGSIRPCDPKMTAFAIAGSLNWIGHWFQRDGAMSAEAIADEFTQRLTEGLASGSGGKRAASTLGRKPTTRRRIK